LVIGEELVKSISRARGPAERLALFVIHLCGLARGLENLIDGSFVIMIGVAERYAEQQTAIHEYRQAILHYA
jgi:hypothetical protein